LNTRNLENAAVTFYYALKAQNGSFSGALGAATLTLLGGGGGVQIGQWRIDQAGTTLDFFFANSSLPMQIKSDTGWTRVTGLESATDLAADRDILVSNNIVANGEIHLTGPNSAITFPDGSVQTNAASQSANPRVVVFNV